MFSVSCGLFGLSKKVNSFAIKQIQPLFAKHPGWGVPLRFPLLESPASRDVEILRALSRHSSLATSSVAVTYDVAALSKVV